MTSSAARVVAAVLILLAVAARPASAADAPTPPKPAAKPPAPRPWAQMDYGPAMGLTVESPLPEPTVTQKGVLVRLDKAAGAYALFDFDLIRWSAFYTAAANGPIDYKGVLYDGSHRTWSSLTGDVVSATRLTPGWADPASGSFTDPRPRFASVDYKPQPEHWKNRGYGPLPREWARYRGVYTSGDRLVFSYDVGGVAVLDSASFIKQGEISYFARTLNVAKSEKDLTILVAEVMDKSARAVAMDQLDAKDQAGSASAPAGTSAALTGPLTTGAVHSVTPNPAGAKWSIADESRICLTIPASATPVRFTLLTARSTPAALAALKDSLRASPAAAEDLSVLTRGGAAHWPDTLHTTGKLDDTSLHAKSNNKPGPKSDPKLNAAPTPAALLTAAYTADNLIAPVDNPYKARIRLSGVDFFADGRTAAASTWDGDVWLISNIDSTLADLQWRRIATGLNQPLGLRIVRVPGAAPAKELIHVSCRDQIARLHDLNGDGEIDFVECVNTDHQVTEHFHEFAMGLDVDSAGNFYYAKAARHALPQVVAHHGTVIRVSADGSRSDVIGTGLRAANGIGVSPDGRVAVSDQEGFWMPANRINVFTPGSAGLPPPFFGNIWGYTSPTRKPEQGYDPPLCWMPPNLDRSPAEQFWVRSDKWGPLAGRLLHTSYGTGRLSLVLDETVDGVPQGGLVAISPLAFPTGVMRGRFNPVDGHLYVCGLVGWSSNTAEPGGLFRVRYTGKPLNFPTSLHVLKDAIQLGFDVPLDKATAQDAGSYSIQQWNYRWTQNYGSKNYKVSDPAKQGQDDVEVSAVTLSPDVKTVTLKIPNLAPVMQMKIELSLKSADGAEIRHIIHNTINRVPKGN